MSETEPTMPASADSQFETLVADVESRFIVLEDAIADLRHAIVRLKAHKPAGDATRVSIAAERVAASPESTEELVSSLGGIELAVEEETAVAEQVPSTEQDEEAKREEVRRVAAEVRAEMEPKLGEPTVGIPFWPGPKAAEAAEAKEPSIEDYGMDSTSEGSWPIARQGEPKAAPSHLKAEASGALAEEPVEAASTEPDDVAAAADEDDDAHRDEVERIVTEMRDAANEDERSDEGDEAEAASEETPSGGEDDDEARRLEVARMVAEMRNGAMAGDTEEADGEDGESKREDVAGIVASMQTDMQGEAASAGDDPDALVRDEVRRAVEAARAEMSSGYTHSADAEGETKFSFPDWQTTHVEPSGPPVIVIKDPEGRVELARVYETLSRVNCDENAALLNYTPHSVTVGLNARASVPGVEDLVAAVEAVFGRKAEVDSDGVRVNVQIGKDLKGKDSAA
jgi:hypothetical protein